MSISDERVKRIVSQVRQYLGEISNVNIQDRHIYNKANFIQTELMLDTKCVEKEFEIILLKDTEDYSFVDENVLAINSYETSWGGTLYKVKNQNWHTISTTGEQYPIYYTIFNNTLKLRPIPLRDDDTIIFRGYQTAVINRMDQDVPPEIPAYCDYALIFGICAEFNPAFIPKYEAQKSKIISNAHIKSLDALERDINW